MRTYSAQVYRDDVENQAAVESFTIGDSFETPEEARDAIRDYIRRDDWHYGSIHEGEFEPAVFGVRPAHFDSDLDVTPWQVDLTVFEQG